MYRLSYGRLLKLSMFTSTCCLLFVTHHIANQYHYSMYQALTDDRDLKPSVDTLKLSISPNKSILIQDKIYQIFYDLARLKSQSTHLNASIVWSDVSVNKTFVTLEQQTALLERFNITIDQFEPNTNTNDKYLFMTLTQVNQLDGFLKKNKSTTSSPIEVNIDKRKKKGFLTSLKAAEFEGITRIRYGAKLCESTSYGANLQVVVFVITKPEDFKIRSIIRNTWGKKFGNTSGPSRLYFCFGQPSSKSLKSSGSLYHSKEFIDVLLKEEDEQFGDIIQWMFEDGYYRLTIKSLAIVRWASVYCPRVQNVFKVDADHLLNFDNVIRFCHHLQNQTNVNATKLIDQVKSKTVSSTNMTSSIPFKYAVYGKIWSKAMVFRSHKSKFYTSFFDYPKKTYPDYVGGPWFLAGESCPLLIYLTAVKRAMPALLWEDLFITGIVGERLISAQIPFERRSLPGFGYMVAANKINACLYNKSLIFTQTINENNLASLWEKVNSHNQTKGDTKCQLII